MSGRRDILHRTLAGKVPWFFSLLLAVLATFARTVVAAVEDEGADRAAAQEIFEKQVRPVLAETCLRCHGEQKKSGGLLVTSRESLLAGGESGAALAPGDADASLLVRAVRREEGVSAMPPDARLRADQVQALARWIEAGAPWPAGAAPFTAAKHWAFEPIADPPAPAVRDTGWAKSSIDHFVLAELEQAGRQAAPPAERRNLLRRVTFDLVGLPPTLEEMAAFLTDSSPQAWDRAVERLLASPHYGEHWGRHWLDVVRYADTAGENSDHPLPHAWRYRNWVIDAFNRDMPYDQFIREQIAGDILAAEDAPARYADHVVATGYWAIARRFGHDIDKDMHLTLEDAIDTLGKSVLGLTLGCCRCHDHKYDPLTSRDYYGLYGILASTRFAFPGCEPKQQPRDLVPLLPPRELQQQTEAAQRRLAAMDAERSQLAAQNTAALDQLKTAAAADNWRTLGGGEIADGGDCEFRFAEEVAVRPGDVLTLAIAPQQSHGADSTAVHWEVAESGGENRRWSTADLVADLIAGNPHADRYGHAAVWWFLDARDGLALLPESLGSIDGRAELRAWRNGDTPSVFVNSSSRPVKVWTTLSAGTFFAHPGSAGPVALAWVSPFEGAVTLRGKIGDAHPGGDGVAWTLRHAPAGEITALLLAHRQAQEKLSKLRGEREALAAAQSSVPVAYAVSEGTAANARLQRRGDPEVLGDEVPRKFLDVLGGQAVAETDSSGRRELAQWLTAAGNPLTARVIVNRVWQWHFGRGLVATPNDFGSRGAAPTHPRLLDHLATHLIQSGWSIKSLHRLILRSATYQQAAIGSEADPLWGRFVRRRLTADELRDALLAVSGELDAMPAKAHPFPAESTWSFTQHVPFSAEYETAKRSVYVMQKRNRRSRFFALFDGADPNASTPARDVTTVPTQALFFMNDAAFHERTARFAARVCAFSANDGARLDYACQLLFGRAATHGERADMDEFLRQYSVALSDPVAGQDRSELAWQALARVLLASNEFLYAE